jgi:YbbR domain-containing protein
VETLRRIFLDNWNLKLISFLFAVVLYSLVHGGQDARRSIVVELEAILPPESANRTLQSPIPQNVRLTIRGSSREIDDLRASAVTLLMDVSDGRQSHVTFEQKMVKAPAGLTFVVEQFEPPGVDLTWEERITRDVPVQVSVVGTPSKGYVVKGIPVPDPPMVKVRGPMSEASVLQHVRAEAFDVTGMSEGTFTKRLALDKVSPRLKVDPQTVIVTTEIMREVAERPFTKLSVVVVGPPHAKTLPPEVDIRLVCPPDILRGLRAEQVVPRVEVSSKDAAGSVSAQVLVSVEHCEATATPGTVVVRW